MLPKLRQFALQQKWLAIIPRVIATEGLSFTPEQLKRDFSSSPNNPCPSSIIKLHPFIDLNNLNSRRGVFTSTSLFVENKKEETATEANEDINDDEDSTEKMDKAEPSGGQKKQEPVLRHLNKDRTKIISVETSMRYMKSAAYKETYGDTPVWVLYRRNFPGQFPPKRTRKTCIRGGVITTGNPCPICRDEYLVIHHCNADLLQQFISPHNGEIIGYDKTGVCRRQHERLLIAIDRAKDYGLITFDVPFREYDYKEYEKIYASY